jgi:uncharacterized SAM-binding protein YcdF (DUF218 family)
VKRTLLAVLFGLFVLLLIAFLFRTPILTSLGLYLDRSGPPQSADAIFVLAGDASGNRILKGAELARQGFAPQVVVSGPEGNYGYYECDLAIPFAVKAGYPESYFVRFPNHALSTEEEAAAAAVELRSLGAHRVLLVTSVYHTRRAGADFRAAAPDLTFFVVAAPDVYFTPNGWWHNRQARKTFLNEWLKTGATLLHL